MPSCNSTARVPFAKGGQVKDKNWIQSVNKSIKKRGTKGKCTPITKPGCTGRAKALAKTFKKNGEKQKKEVSIKEAILEALRQRYEAQIAEADALVNLYLRHSVGIGEHPQNLDEVDKQLGKISQAEGKLSALDEFLEQREENNGEEEKD